MRGFDAARRAALFADLFRVLTGRPTDLLAFSDVRRKLNLTNLVNRGVQEIPLDQIVGTIGREREFNRAFLPREESLRGRWEGIEELSESFSGYPSVDLYKVGDIYFVVDGHHRVSVARATGAPTIEANVSEFLTDVPIGPDDSVEEMLQKAALGDFLRATGLEATPPDRYRLSEIKGYERLLEHVNGHRYYRSIEEGRQISWEEAVRSWKENVYDPMIETIRASAVLEEFPDSTETDLYLFTMDHLHHLRQRYDPSVSEGRAVREVKARQSKQRRSKKRLGFLVRRRPGGR